MHPLAAVKTLANTPKKHPEPFFAPKSHKPNLRRISTSPACTPARIGQRSRQPHAAPPRPSPDGRGDPRRGLPLRHQSGRRGRRERAEFAPRRAGMRTSPSCPTRRRCGTSARRCKFLMLSYEQKRPSRTSTCTTRRGLGCRSCGAASRRPTSARSSSTATPGPARIRERRSSLY